MVSWWLLSRPLPGIHVREGAQLRTKSTLTAVCPDSLRPSLEPPTAPLQALVCPEEGFQIPEDKWVRSPTCLRLPFQSSSVSTLALTFRGRACDSWVRTRTLRFGEVVVLPKITS